MTTNPPNDWGLNWKDEGEYQTRHGLRRLHSSLPTKTWWEVWNNDAIKREQLRKQGFAMSRDGFLWRVLYWSKPLNGKGNDVEKKRTAVKTVRRRAAR